MANNLPLPRKEYPALAATIKAYLKRFIGFNNHFQKDALLPQDVEHLIDTCGIESIHSLQHEYDRRLSLIKLV